MTARHRRAAAIVGAMLLVLTAGACTGGDNSGSDERASRTAAPTTSATVAPDDDVLGPGRGLSRYFGQRVEWTDCGGEFECATVLVPLDYEDVSGDAVGIAVSRLPAGDSDARLGSQLVNPGGPGGSGVSFVKQAAGIFGEDVLASYDLVGFDPRGVGGSEPLECLDTQQLDTWIASDPDPDGPAETAEAEQLVRSFASACRHAAPELLPHMSTVDVARDLDVLRAALGDRELHYLGFSYGTLIGAVYAELFPGRVGRMVLDGAVDPTQDGDEALLGQAGGFQTALESYAADCVTKPGCPLGTDVDAGLDRLRVFIDGLDADPLPTDDPERPLTQSLGLFGILAPLYNKAMWPGLTLALKAALEDGVGQPLLLIGDVYNQRYDDDYASNQQQVSTAVNCLDRPDHSAGQLSVEDFERVAPTIAPGFAGAVTVDSCGPWPKAASPLPSIIDAEGAAPIVVVGTTRDPATPYEQAQSLADQLDSAVLLTRDGDGHTAYGSGNECIDATIDAYLVRGVVPRDGTRC